MIEAMPQFDIHNPDAFQDLDQMVNSQLTPEMTIGEQSYNADYAAQIDAEYMKSVLDLSTNFDVLGSLSHHPDDKASLAQSKIYMEAITAQSLQEETFSYDSLKAEIDRRQAHAAAIQEAEQAQERMDMFVIDNYIAIQERKSDKEDDNEGTNVVRVNFQLNKKSLAKAA